MTTDLPFAPAAERNKLPILQVLQQHLPATGKLLEIGSGTGQHVVCFASTMSNWVWQPSEQRLHLPALQMRLQQEASHNVLTAIELDVAEASHWPLRERYAAVFAANVAHIMSWPQVESMFAGIQRCLQADGKFLLYGPFHCDGQPTADSNAAFDAQLRSADNRHGSHQGIRDDRAVIRLGIEHGLQLVDDVAMPANNRILIFQANNAAGLEPDTNHA
jgi:cyclopropane fatty-acyl-phospholipid synthase-like methyltransferase